MEKKTKLYQQIFEDFMGRISSGVLKAGDRIPTEHELAEQYQVSRITVIRAMRELENRGLLVRAKGRGSFIANSIPPPNTAPGSGSAAMPIISVLLPFSQDIGYDILRGIEEESARAGYYITFHNTKYDIDLERELILKLVEDQICGLIIYPCASDKNIDIYSLLLIKKFPFILIDRTINGLDAPLVVSDNFKAGYKITNHLVSLGHRRIGFVTTLLKEAESIEQRHKGYCKALIDAGIIPKEEWLIEETSYSVSNNKITLSDPQILEQIAARRWTRMKNIIEPLTAVVAINDYSAMYLMRAILRDGVSVPEQMSITGFDNLSFTEYLEVPLTTVEQNFQLIGRKAAELVVNQIIIQVENQDEKQGETQSSSVTKVMLDTELIIRKSTTAPGQQ